MFTLKFTFMLTSENSLRSLQKLAEWEIADIHFGCQLGEIPTALSVFIFHLSITPYKEYYAAFTPLQYYSVTILLHPTGTNVSINSLHTAVNRL